MRRSVTLVAVATLLACTESNFIIPPVVLEHPIDNKVTVSGGFCAEGADDLEMYLKIMFIIDRSNSLNETDPNNQRIIAIANVINQFIDNPLTQELRAGVEIALVSFWGDVAVHTRNRLGLTGFSTDGPKILASLVRIAETSSNTGYDKALATAFNVLDTDMARLSDQARQRSRYEVFFLSDGMPFPDNCTDESNSLRVAVQGAERIKALEAAHGVSVQFHTAFASVPGMFTLGLTEDLCECYGVENPPVKVTDSCDGGRACTGDVDCPGGACLGGRCRATMGDVTRGLLDEMAGAGGGSFKQFENGDAINFLEFQFAESRRLYAMSYFVASNTSARSNIDHVEPDSDSDGLTDLEEYDLGTSPYYADSDGDGFGDGIEERFRLTGLDPLDPSDAQCSDLDRVDTDSDGLLDCEERFLGTSRRSFDSDADGVPDPVEVLARGDANSATPLQDHQMDSDADGGNNAEELRWHTDPKQDDVAKRAKIAYDYYQRELPITTGQACYDFAVRNISLASTIGPPEDRSKGFCVPANAAACDESRPCPIGEECDLFHQVCHTPDAEWCYDDADCTSGSCGNFGHQDGWNRIMLYMAQTPYDDPLADPLYRVACIEGRFIEERDLKIPANGKVNLPSRRIADTYRADYVLAPNNVPCNVSNNYDCGLDSIWCRFSDDGSDCRCCLPANCTSGADCPSGTCRIPGGATEGLCGCGGAGANSAECGGGFCLDVPDNPNLCESINCDTPCPECANGQDDDGDGLTDFPHDPDCFDSYSDNEGADDNCSDGIDNDGDGKVDFPFDSGCVDGISDNEDDPATPPACADGIDNDDNGVMDYPMDPGCYAASDDTELYSSVNPIRACNDGIDNDGDGAVDLADRGCSGDQDIDEDGPTVCFYCQNFTDYLPGQCNIRAGYCRARAGLVPNADPEEPPVPCATHEVCRGAVCVCMSSNDCAAGSTCLDRQCTSAAGAAELPTAGQCSRCLDDEDCDAIDGPGSGICDTTQGWCLTPKRDDQIIACTADAACGGRTCQTDIGSCSIDPYFACRTERDCAPDEFCSEERGFCLERVFQTHQCNGSAPCITGVCDEETGWCHPDGEEDQCQHSDECPFGDCLESGACEQQTFVFPRDFAPEVDCIRQE